MKQPIYNPPFLNDPEFKKWRDRVEAEIQLVAQAIERGEDRPPLKEGIWQDFKKKFLLKADGGLCAYCEGNYQAGGFDDAEHYAPKAKVTHDRKEVKHPGYHWLAYEWRNLLLSCKKCNSSHPDLDNKCSHPGKLNEFPVAKKRTRQPGRDPARWWDDLLSEEPLLLHPYYDRARLHFAARKQGSLYGKTNRGKLTIAICHLNRQELREARQRHEEKAHSRAASITVLTSQNQDPAPQWFARNEEYASYLNCVLREKIMANAKKLSKKADEDW
jgi:hypothetical protein